MRTKGYVTGMLGYRRQPIDAAWVIDRRPREAHSVPIFGGPFLCSVMAGLVRPSTIPRRSRNGCCENGHGQCFMSCSRDRGLNVRVVLECDLQSKRVFRSRAMRRRGYGRCTAYLGCHDEPLQGDGQEILIANRGEIACRIIRDGAAAWGSRPSRSIPRPTPRRCMCAWPTRRSRSGRAPSAESYLRIDRIVDGLPRDRRRGRASRLRLSVGARGVRRGAGRGRHRLHRPERPRRSPRWATRSKSKSWRAPPG